MARQVAGWGGTARSAFSASFSHASLQYISIPQMSGCDVVCGSDDVLPGLRKMSVSRCPFGVAKGGRERLHRHSGKVATRGSEKRSCAPLVHWGPTCTAEVNAPTTDFSFFFSPSALPLHPLQCNVSLAQAPEPLLHPSKCPCL